MGRRRTVSNPPWAASPPHIASLDAPRAPVDWSRNIAHIPRALIIHPTASIGACSSHSFHPSNAGGPRKDFGSSANSCPAQEELAGGRVVYMLSSLRSCFEGYRGFWKMSLDASQDAVPDWGAASPFRGVAGPRQTATASESSPRRTLVVPPVLAHQSCVPE